MTGQLAFVYLALRDLAEPLLRRVSSPEALENLFYRYGGMPAWTTRRSAKRAGFSAPRRKSKSSSRWPARCGRDSTRVLTPT